MDDRHMLSVSKSGSMLHAIANTLGGFLILMFAVNLIQVLCGKPAPMFEGERLFHTALLMIIPVAAYMTSPDRKHARIAYAAISLCALMIVIKGSVLDSLSCEGVMSCIGVIGLNIIVWPVLFLSGWVGFRMAFLSSFIPSYFYPNEKPPKAPWK